MSDRDRAFLALYTECRLNNQRDWYEDRRTEFESARDEINTLNIVLMMLAAAAAALASADLFGQRTLWAVLAVIFPVVSTALSAYDGL